MTRSILVSLVTILFVFGAPVFVAEASPASPSFFESVREWFGDRFTFGDFSNAERNLEKAKAVLEDIERIGEGANEEALLNALMRYSKRLEKAKFYIERARERSKDLSHLVPLVDVATSTKKDLLEAVSPAVFKKAEALKEDIKKYAEESKKEVKNEDGVFCTEEYAPVCGVDGKTYGNKCQALEANKIQIAYGGECKKSGESSAEKPAVSGCTKEYVPVCGANGKTYGNACTAKEAGIKVSYVGVCKALEKPKTPAKPTEPVPVSKPACPELYVPICGLDGKTYTNKCLLEKEGAKFAYDGVCKAPALPPVEPQGDPSSSFDLFLKSASQYGSLLLEGNILNFSAIVVNSGKEKIDTEYFTQLTIDKGDNGNIDLVMAALPGGVLLPGESETHIWKNAFVMEVGSHRATVCTDIYKKIGESDEKNNCSSVTFTVQKKVLLPDLVVYAVSVSPSAPKVGEAMSFKAEIKNKGVGDAEASYAVASLDRENDKTIDTTIGSSPVSPLPPGISDSESWNASWVAVEGIHRLEVCSDAHVVVKESDESNNCTSVLFQVLPATQSGY